MKTTLWFAMYLLALASSALAQTQQEHQQHHPGGQPPAAQAQPAPIEPAQPPAATPTQPQAQMPMGEMMKGMPEHCRAMMQNMAAGCMGMMQGMMGGMMQGQSGVMQGQTHPAAVQSDATKEYMAALDKMHGPMSQGVQESDVDVAFAKGMIAHHQGAIDMANVVLKYGKDEQTKKWAKDVVREQQREIDEMQTWLRDRGK